MRLETMSSRPELASMAEHHLTVVMLKVLIKPHARTGLGQDGGRTLARTEASVAFRRAASSGAEGVAIQVD